MDRIMIGVSGSLDSGDVYDEVENRLNSRIQSFISFEAFDKADYSESICKRDTGFYDEDCIAFNIGRIKNIVIFKAEVETDDDVIIVIGIYKCSELVFTVSYSSPVLESEIKEAELVKYRIKEFITRC